MSEAVPIEKRVEALEIQLTELRRQFVKMQSAEGRFRHLSGSFADEPEFDEVLRPGREIRQADRPDKTQ